MNVLLTGNRGRIGRIVETRLVEAGHVVTGFDLATGQDITDAAAVRSAARGVDTIVHAAGLADDRNAPADEVMRVNFIGTSNVLLAAEAEGAHRIVHLSSGKALGMLERDPDYLPMDDDHRGLPTRAYGLAKWLSEEMCSAFTLRTGIDTICLRPVAVFDDEGYRKALATPKSTPAAIWSLGVHIHVDDVADATVAAVGSSVRGHQRLLLCAEDIADARPTLDLVARNVPQVEWRGGAEYSREPFRSLIDIARARETLNWAPQRRWPGRAAVTSAAREV